MFPPSGDELPRSMPVRCGCQLQWQQSAGQRRQGHIRQGPHGAGTTVANGERRVAGQGKRIGGRHVLHAIVSSPKAVVCWDEDQRGMCLRDGTEPCLRNIESRGKGRLRQLIC